MCAALGCMAGSGLLMLGTPGHPQAAKEMGYEPTASPPRGEICIRGPMVFAGYYKMEGKTKDSFGAGSTAFASLLQAVCIVHRPCCKPCALAAPTIRQVSVEKAETLRHPPRAFPDPADMRGLMQ